MVHLTLGESLLALLASLSRIKEVRCHDLLDYSLIDFFSRVTADQLWRLGRLGG